MEDVSAIKSDYQRAVANNDVATLCSLVEPLIALSPTLGIAQLIIKTLPVDLPQRPGVTSRIAVLRSFTVEPFLPFIKAYGRLYGIDITFKVGEFNSYAQEIIDPSSWLYEFEPDIVILALQTRDIAPDVWQSCIDINEEQLETTIDSILSSTLSLIDRLRERSNATVIVQSFEQPITECAGVLDSRRQIGQAELIRQLNRSLTKYAIGHNGVYVMDYDALIARHGRIRWNDEKKWVTSRSPISADCLPYIAQEYLKLIVPLAGRQSKVLVIDLDNTLWGGVVGEDGVSGVKIGLEYPGSSFLALQRAILHLRERGILLAICSKNNEVDALEVFEKRQEMLLKPHHFSAMRINWTDKAQNLRAIAAELNVGIDSIVFVDDNPVERQRVKLELPEVTVVNLPDDPAGYAAALRSVPVFERLKVTLEDRERGNYYAQQRERKQLESSVHSLEDFYRSLEMKAEFVGVTSETIERISQLTQKTNQLNMTTKRYTESEVMAMAEDSAWILFGIRIIDKFGDNGIVGAVFLHITEDSAIIDTFLLSCRVIGRTVETAMLARASQLVNAANRTVMRGWFYPTKKNEPAQNIYADNGFVCIGRSDIGTLWEINLERRLIPTPEWF